jgi:hypothetical protein
MKIFKWNWFLTIILSIQWTTFMGQNNHKLILGGIIIKIVLIIKNNTLIYFILKGILVTI